MPGLIKATANKFQFEAAVKSPASVIVPFPSPVPQSPQSISGLFYEATSIVIVRPLLRKSLDNLRRAVSKRATSRFVSFANPSRFSMPSFLMACCTSGLGAGLAFGQIFLRSLRKMDTVVAPIPFPRA